MYSARRAKTSVRDVQDLAETLAALANGRGGVLTLPAPRKAESLIDQVLQAALSTEPPLILPIPQAGKASVQVTVPDGLPHVYAVEGRYLIREAEQNIPLGPERLRRLLIERGGLSFEDVVITDAGLSDLDWSAVERYAARLNSADSLDLLIRRGCVRLCDGKPTPTHAGLLLFGKDPTRYIRGAFITAAQFAGQQMGDVFTRQEISGALPDQIRKAETFLIDHLRHEVRLTGAMQRDEQFTIPLEAAREVLVNAVAHRDYSIQGDGIRLYLFADRMEVTSPGKLPGPVTLANMVDERFSRNSIIVQVLADMGFIERLGYGIDRILSLMQAGELPAPEFAETGGGFRAVLHGGVLVQPPAPQPLTLHPRQQLALDYLESHTAITNREYQELCPDVHSETLRRDLADLVHKGLIQRMGEKRGSYYVRVREE